MEPDEEIPDEETIEVMKSIWFKAGEMEDDLSSDDERKKKRSSKSRKHKTSSTSSKLKRNKPEGQKPTSTTELVDPLAIEVLPSSKAMTLTTSTTYESTSPLTLKKVQVTYPAKPSLTLPANFLSSSQTLAPFRIPKKNPSDLTLKTDANALRQWSDADSAAGVTLVKMATSVKERGFHHHQKDSPSRNYTRPDPIATYIRRSSHSINYSSKPTCNYELSAYFVCLFVCLFARFVGFCFYVIVLFSFVGAVETFSSCENTKEMVPGPGQPFNAISSKWCADIPKSEAAAQTSPLKHLLLGTQSIDSSSQSRRDSNASSRYPSSSTSDRSDRSDSEKLEEQRRRSRKQKSPRSNRHFDTQYSSRPSAAAPRQADCVPFIL